MVCRYAGNTLSRSSASSFKRATEEVSLALPDYTLPPRTIATCDTQDETSRYKTG